MELAGCSAGISHGRGARIDIPSPPIQRISRHQPIDAIVAALEEIGSASVSTSAVDAVLHRILEKVVALTRAEQARVVLVETDGKTRYCARAYGRDAADVEGTRGPLDEGLHGWVIRTCQSLLLNDAPADPRARNEAWGGACIIAPLKSDERVLGCLSAWHQDPAKRFRRRDLHVLRVLASYAAVTLKHARLHQALSERFQTLEILYEVASALVGNLRLETVLQLVSERCCQLTGAETATVSLLSEDGKMRTHVAGFGKHLPLLLGQSLSTDEGIIGGAISSRTAILVNDVAADPRVSAVGRHLEGASAIVAPLIVRGDVIGCLFAAHSAARGRFDRGHLQLMQFFATQAAVAIENARLHEQARELYISGVKALAITIDTRDPTTHGHSERIARYSKMIAIEMGLNAKEVERIELAGLLHDIGKIGVPESILNKSGHLDPHEQAIVRAHTSIGAQILRQSGFLKDLEPIVRGHHEWYDGAGYPDGLRGDAIPIGACIVAVADAFDTMTSNRTYRQGIPVAAALEELKRNSGTQFHPAVVDAIGRLVVHAMTDGAGWLREVSVLASMSAGPPPLPTIVAQQTALSTRELAVILRTVEVMETLLDLPETLNRVATILREEMGYGDLRIMLIDEESGDLVTQASSGLGRETIGERRSRGKGVGWAVIEQGTPLYIPDRAKEPRHLHAYSEPWSELYVPLIMTGKPLGVLVARRMVINGFTEMERRVLAAIARHVASVVGVAQLHDQVKRAAATDPMTGIPNLRHFTHQVKAEIARAQRYGRRFTVAILDADDFKTVNETYGHLAGDAVLTTIARGLQAHVRQGDLVARYGGDEFVLLMHETSLQEAVDAVARTLSARAPQVVEHEGMTISVPTLCYGVAAYPDDGLTLRDLLTQADLRLSQHKRP